jgi:hypothetical protein
VGAREEEENVDGRTRETDSSESTTRARIDKTSPSERERQPCREAERELGVGKDGGKKDEDDERIKITCV